MKSDRKGSGRTRGARGRTELIRALLERDEVVDAHVDVRRRWVASDERSAAGVHPSGRVAPVFRIWFDRVVVVGCDLRVLTHGSTLDLALGRRRATGDMADIGALVTNAQTLCASDAGLAELQTILDANKDGLAERGDACLAALESGALRPDAHALAWIHLLCAVAGARAAARRAPMHELDPAGEMDIAGIGSQGSDQPPSQSPAPSPAPPAGAIPRSGDVDMTSVERPRALHLTGDDAGGAAGDRFVALARRRSARRARARTRRGIPPSLRASAPSSSPSPSQAKARVGDRAAAPSGDDRRAKLGPPHAAAPVPVPRGARGEDAGRGARNAEPTKYEVDPKTTGVAVDGLSAVLPSRRGDIRRAREVRGGVRHVRARRAELPRAR